MIRGIASIMILTGCFGLGILHRENLNGRIRALQQLADILELLEGEVRYGRAVLPECCLRVGEQVKGGFGEALIRVFRETEEDCGIPFGEIFREIIGKQMEGLPLKREDEEAFFQFLSPAGFADGQMQERAMQLSRERLEKTKERLERESAEKGRIAVGLGAMGGLLLILILW